MQLVKFIDGKKFMWDGACYHEKEEATGVMEKYARDGFETRMIQEEGQIFLFTRRVVAEAKAVPS